MVKFVFLFVLPLLSHAALQSLKSQNGYSVVSGEEGEIQQLKATVDRKLKNINRRKQKQPTDTEAILNKYSSIKLMIQRQMVKDVIQEIQPLTLDGKPWNASMGMPPLRGSYDSLTLTHDLESLGLKKDAKVDGQHILPQSHYCKHRTPSEKNGDTMSCCVGENTECYTTAGCFCDESCYTKYGDCCTDHFLTCYEHLKLCLIKVDTSGESEAKGRKVSKNSQDNYMASQNTDILARAAILDNGMKPQHVEPDACCLQVPYNSQDTDGNGNAKNCCRGVLTHDTCSDYDDEEELTYPVV